MYDDFIRLKEKGI